MIVIVRVIVCVRVCVCARARLYMCLSEYAYVCVRVRTRLNALEYMTCHRCCEHVVEPRQNTSTKRLTVITVILSSETPKQRNSPAAGTEEQEPKVAKSEDPHVMPKSGPTLRLRSGRRTEKRPQNSTT